MPVVRCGLSDPKTMALFGSAWKGVGPHSDVLEATDLKSPSLRTYTLFGNKSQEGLAQYMIREVFARLGDQEDGEGRPCGVTVCGSALELYNNHFIDLLRPIDKTGRQSPGVKVGGESTKRTRKGGRGTQIEKCF